MFTILLADEDVQLCGLVKDFLLKENYNVLESANGTEALHILNENPQIHLAIINMTLPYCDGWIVLKNIRRLNNNLPVIMLISCVNNSNEYLGIQFGADDYITKPFSPIVLMIRVKLLLRKHYFIGDKSVKKYGNITIDETGHRVLVNDEQIELSRKEYDLLIYLSLNRDVAVTREQILNVVWGYDYFGEMRTVDTHIKKLRAKLGSECNMIQTVRGYGYRFEA